jgi:hypothetical protein
MDAVTCSSCDAQIDLDDNYCRKCGAPMNRDLPAVRVTSSIARWQPDVTPVVRGAAVMAAGAMGQFVFRRIVGNMLRGTGRKPRAAQRRAGADDGLADEAHIITEMVMTRRVRLRRPD